MLERIKTFFLIVVGLITLPIWVPVGVVMKTGRYLAGRGQDVVDTTVQTYGVIASMLRGMIAIVAAGRDKLIEALKPKVEVITDPANAEALKAAVAADEAAAAEAAQA